MTQSNFPHWDDIAIEKDRYEVGGGSKSDPRTETVWTVFGHEVRIRVRRRTRNGRTWQYYVNATVVVAARRARPTSSTILTFGSSSMFVVRQLTTTC